MYPQAKEIAAGLKYLHDNDVIHGDLKVVCSLSVLEVYWLIIPQDNILISDREEAQITDFGLAQILDVTGFTTLIERNARFTAPELLSLVDDSSRPTRQSDVFSLGILLLQVCLIKCTIVWTKNSEIFQALPWTRSK